MAIQEALKRNIQIKQNQEVLSPLIQKSIDRKNIGKSEQKQPEESKSAGMKKAEVNNTLVKRPLPTEESDT